MSFHDEPASQAYLSLGLTPLSQLSGMDNQEVGFFPGLPPPIAPMADNERYSIPVDGPLLMDDGKKSTKVSRVSGLETVLEQPPRSPSSKYSDGSHVLSPFQRTTQQDETFVFPSASVSLNYLGSLNNPNRSTSPHGSAPNPGFSTQHEDDPLIDFNEYGSGFSIHVDSSPEPRQNGHAANYSRSSVNRASPPEGHLRPFTRGDGRRQLIKRSRGDLSQRSTQELHLQYRKKGSRSFDDDEDDDDDDVAFLRPTSPPGVYPPQFNDVKMNKFTPPEKDQNVRYYDSMNSISSLKEDHAVTSLI